jgi:hypothetical protein
LWGATGARSVAALVAWKTGSSSANAATIATVASRLAAFPRCAQGMREGRLSLDQIGVIAGRAGEGSDEHYAQLAAVATVNQLRTAVKLEPRPEPEPGSRGEPQRSITKVTNHEFTDYRIRLANIEAAKFDAALQSHLDALVAQWKRDHDDPDRASDNGPAVAHHRRGVPAPGRGRVGCRGGPPPARAAHHRGDTSGRQGPSGSPASGPVAVGRRPPIPAV